MIKPIVTDLIGRYGASLEDQLVATGVVVLLLLGSWVGVRATRTRDIRPVITVALGIVAVGVTLLAIVVLVAVWGGSAVILSVLEVFQLGNPVLTVFRIGFTVLILFGTYLLTGVVRRLLHEVLSDRGSISQHQTELTFRTTQVGLFLLAGIVILGIWNVDLSGILVGAGFLGIVLGLAARQTLGALIAGFVLMFARPFEIGDWVEIGDREGIVTEISIVNTRIQTFDGEYAMLPNDVVGSQEIINRTRKGRLRIHVTVGVDYETDLKEAVDLATDAMREVDDILSVPQPRVLITEFADSAIVLDLRYWIDKPSVRRQNQSRSAVILAVKSAFDEADIKIPFPQRELMGRREEGGFQLAGRGNDEYEDSGE